MKSFSDYFYKKYPIQFRSDFEHNEALLNSLIEYTKILQAHIEKLESKVYQNVSKCCGAKITLSARTYKLCCWLCGTDLKKDQIIREDKYTKNT